MLVKILSYLLKLTPTTKQRQSGFRFAEKKKVSKKKRTTRLYLLIKVLSYLLKLTPTSKQRRSGFRFAEKKKSKQKRKELSTDNMLVLFLSENSIIVPFLTATNQSGQTQNTTLSQHFFTEKQKAFVTKSY